MIENSSTAVDRNFDDLAQRFQRNVYASLKGSIRLGVLQRDFEEFLPLANDALSILDAGGGQGQMSAYFAQQGHEVLLCDISGEMLAMAERNLAEAGLLERVMIRQQSIQELIGGEQRLFDLVVCHAVLEWVAEPEALLATLAAALKPGGILSLTYYNLNGLVYKNLLRNNFKKIRRKNWQGYRGSLTPSNPLRPEVVNRWLGELQLETLCESGIRVFHDYILEPEERNRDPAGVLEMELKHSRVMPFTHLGRYIHVLCQKPSRGGSL